MEKDLIQIKVPKEMKKRLKESTKESGLTINSLLVVLINKYLEEKER